MELSTRARLRAGDQRAYGELFDEHADAVYGYVLRTLGDWAAAEDVGSLTFLEAWRLRGSLHEEGGTVRPWLFGIATNVLRNTARAGRRHRAALARLPRREAVPDFAEELVTRLDDGARLDAVRRAVGRWGGCGAVSARCSGCACGSGSTTPRRRRPWACRSAQCGPGSPGLGGGCAP